MSDNVDATNRIDNEDDDFINNATGAIRRVKHAVTEGTNEFAKSSANAATDFGKSALNSAKDNILTRNLTTTGAVLGKSADAVGNEFKAAIKTTGRVLGKTATALGSAKDKVVSKLGDATEVIDNKLKDAAETVGNTVKGAINTTGKFTGYNAARRTFDNTLVTDDDDNKPNKITQLLMDSDNLSTKESSEFLTAAKNDLTNAKTAYTRLSAASITDKSMKSAAKDAGARVKYAQAVVEFIEANNNDEDFINKFIEFRKGQLSNITQVAERVKGMASTFKNLTPFSFSNSRTQKNQQGSNGLKQGVKGQKYTLTFFKDVNNQCYFEKCELCTKTLEQYIPEDRKVIDENNRQIRSNIQTIAKISPSLCDANNANVANSGNDDNNDNSDKKNGDDNDDSNNDNDNDDNNNNINANDAIKADVANELNGGYDANKKSRSVGTRRKSRSMKLGKNQARRSRRYL